VKISANRKSIIVVGLAAIGVWAFCAIVHPLEPRYGGKRLSQWADILALFWDEYPDEQMAGEAQSRHNEAENAIRHIGPRALPYAIKWCRATNDASQEAPHDWFHGKKLFGVELEELYPELRPSHVISANDLHERSGAIFRILGPGAKSEIPILIDLLGDKDGGVASTAAGDLYDIGSDAVAPLISALTNRNAQVRGVAASLFELSFPAATSAVSALSLCLSDPDSKVRFAAAFALGRLGTNAPEIVVPALLNSLRKETNSINMLTLETALGRFGTNAQTAMPVLKHILETKQATPLGRQTQWAALTALNKINPEAAVSFRKKWDMDLTNEIAPKRD